MHETKWYIWSIEHSAWWKPNNMGYTTNKDEAGLYSFRSACIIINDANAFGEVKEAIIPDDSTILQNIL